MLLALYRAVLLARIVRALAYTCRASTLEPALAIEAVAWTDARPLDAAARLVGAGCHETRFAVKRQARGGPAVTWWQLEVRRAEREALLADDIAAARFALRIARTCHGDFSGYASGHCGGAPEAAASLRRAMLTARAGLGW